MKTFSKRVLILSPVAGHLEKPTATLEAAEVSESDSQQTETKRLVLQIQNSQVTAGSYCCKRGFLLSPTLPYQDPL